ncbi:MAG: cAMP/cGMP-dependent 3',5'-cyclic-AMP/GMP phosphodiesterase [Spirochaetaceae bacterium]
MGASVVTDPIDHKNIVTALPRGGYLVQTPEGNIQFGAPPETIKDTIPTVGSVPRVFVLPRVLFHWQKGINVADMEFPIYFNFFLRKQRVTVFCTDQQARRLVVALRQAVFGPRSLNLESDAYPAADDAYVPDITGEVAYFRRGLKLADLLAIRRFDTDGSLHYGRVTIRQTERGLFEVYIDDELAAEVPDTVQYRPTYDIGERLPEPYVPPRFGVSCLGPSHGFDPNDNTSGFIIWLHGNGIMVDPPVNSTEWLERSNVNPKFIDSIILTHCHADHDAGTFQKILEESRVTIYTTPTIMQSFLTKYAAFSGESPRYLRRLFTYHPVYVGRSFYLHGGEFHIFYTLHSIPTMGFKLAFQDKTFVYSSDHQADPEVQRDMYENGYISERRYQQLSHFPWDSDVIYHEAGIAPLHTPIAYLNSLPVDIQRRTVVYHIAKKDFPPPEETELTLATFGIENTLYFETEKSPHEEAYRILDVLKHLDFFHVLPVYKVQEFLSIVERRTYTRGEKIIEQGTTGNEFYIIRSGTARVHMEELVRGKYLGAYEYFGEVALLTGRPRTADIIAETDVELYAIPKSKFINFIAGTEFERVLRRLIQNRSEETWNILVSSAQLAVLTDYQRMWLESVLVRTRREEPGELIPEGEIPEGIFLVGNGTVSVLRGGHTAATLSRGDVVGSMRAIERDEPSAYTYRHEEPVDLFFIPRDDALQFLKRNPGAAMRLGE